MTKKEKNQNLNINGIWLILNELDKIQKKLNFLEASQKITISLLEGLESKRSKWA